MSEPLLFGSWLKRRRRTLDLTQGALAQLVGCSVHSIRKFENDLPLERARPDIAREQVGAAVFAGAWASGRALSLEQAIDEAIG